ncbi:MAG: DNA-directed RNA polymerase subunit H [Candidatus Wukongarchaeota archaeon]|nr:DNA-directed RNA polymerase subunit H [Candidatus Wukongarchaeota archaeon]MDO8129532.1 DNA-directed RNA polymerase subunit H [Candidatus Wukongarchaeota archaeon]
MPAEYAFFDIFVHDLVPEHEIVSEEEVGKLVKDYGIQVNQLAMLKASDPVARAVGARAGDVVKITRKSPTAGVSVAYRYVVK